MERKQYIKILFFSIIINLFRFSFYAQEEGPRMFLLEPTRVLGTDLQWQNINQNFLSSGSILSPQSDFKVNHFQTKIFYNFAIQQRFAQASFMFNPGSITGDLVSEWDTTYSDLKATGFADGNIGFKLGLIGTPGVNAVQFPRIGSMFSMFLNLKVWYSGNFKESEIINRGSGRLSYEIGLPMAIPFGFQYKRQFWLETYPFTRLYTKNPYPEFIYYADNSQQLPLVGIENHLSRNFTENLWFGVDLKYQYGGEIELDGQNQRNINNFISTGLTAGYEIIPRLNAYGSYNVIMLSDVRSRQYMIRLGVRYLYAPMKGLKPKMIKVNR